MTDPNTVSDAFRDFDAILGGLLVFGLLERFWMRSRPSVISGPMAERIAMRVALVSWLMLTISAASADFIRQGEPADLSLALRLIGHGVGVLYCGVAWSIDRERKKKATLRNSTSVHPSSDERIS